MQLFRRKRFWAVLLIVGTPLLVLLLAHVQGKWALSRMRQQLTARGEKLAIEENERIPTDRRENPFRDFIQEVNQLRSGEAPMLSPPVARQAQPGKMVPLHWLQTWPATQRRTNANWASLSAALAITSNECAEVRSYLQGPLPTPRLDYHKGFKLLLPHLAQLKWLAQYLNADVLNSLHEGQLDLAKSELRDVLATAEILKHEPLLISQLVRYAILSLAMQATWQALQVPGWTDAQLLELQKAWQSVELMPDMIAALEMERAMVLECYASVRRSASELEQYLGGGGMGGPGGGGSSSGGTFDSFGDLMEQVTSHAVEGATKHVAIPVWQFAFSYGDEQEYLATAQDILEATRTAGRERSAEPLVEAKKRFEERARRTGLSRLRYMMSKILTASLGSALDRTLTAETQKEIVIAAIAARRYTLRHGKPPATLQELVPEFVATLPHDYWGNAPLIYRAGSNNPPVLYSVGPDRKDEGGQAAPENNAKTPALLTGRDLVWPHAVTALELPAALKALGCDTNLPSTNSRHRPAH